MSVIFSKQTLLSSLYVLSSKGTNLNLNGEQRQRHAKMAKAVAQWDTFSQKVKKMEKIGNPNSFYYKWARGIYMYTKIFVNEIIISVSSLCTYSLYVGRKSKNLFSMNGLILWIKWDLLNFFGGGIFVHVRYNFFKVPTYLKNDIRSLSHLYMLQFLLELWSALKLKDSTKKYSSKA